ncbi:AlpA family phage regulatory protein [Uruburuella suis]|jgi:prophage regulatory protein|uniref:AlpA family phage regulatory protein n=1 Tax=Uruburuella suis TaxID=252130 RepID=A0AAE9GV31_9NEIS|nr:AlpA family phage regulatory protein [Uruburuella suis]TCP10203.1 CP4-57 regulatory protein AlpA [Uruburuella suis]UOO80420.1 AlpA family phage regulatory protein [Uruburuella suis]
MQQINLNNLSDDAQLTMAELETSKVKNRRGITRLSGSQIRRLEAQGIFPKSRQITGTKCRFYVAGEVKQWLAQQAANS